MSISIKPGVELYGIRTEILLAVIVADSCHPTGKVTITSVMDGKHKTRSRHYVGHAVDLRIKDISSEQATAWYNNLSGALGSEYTVILNSDHIHVQFSPR